MACWWSLPAGLHLTVVAGLEAGVTVRPGVRAVVLLLSVRSSALWLVWTAWSRNTSRAAPASAMSWIRTPRTSELDNVVSAATAATRFAWRDRAQTHLRAPTPASLSPDRFLWSRLGVGNKADIELPATAVATMVKQQPHWWQVIKSGKRRSRLQRFTCRTPSPTWHPSKNRE
jgi:hypothetical protein